MLLAMACEQVSVTAEGKVSLDQILRSAVEVGDVPGVVAIVTNRDSILYRGAFGVMDGHGAQTMRPDAIFLDIQMPDFSGFEVL